MSSIVVETVVPVMTCGRCGVASTQGQRFCTDCGALLGRTVASAEYDALQGVAAAGAGGVLLARLVDLVVCLLGGAAGAALLFLAHTAVPSSDPVGTAVAGAVAGLVVTAAIVVIRASRTGRGPGGLLVGTRVVDVDDALPAGPVRQIARLGGGPHRRASGAGPWAAATGTVTASLRTGREPLDPAAPALGTAFGAAASAGVRPGSAPLPGGAVEAGLDATRRAGFGSTPAAGPDSGFGSVPPPTAPVADDSVPVDAVVLRFDSGVLHWFRGTCVIGRNPEAEPGVATVAVPDLSRTLSKTHVALVQVDGAVVLRDLGSTNGTSVIRPDASFEDLVPGVDLPVPAGSTVRIGDHAFVVDRVGATT
ncbi:FHA domain-containing protein [Curtobacterium sp. MCPF17_002]|uniref:FHA domain-containing protein n=1 Tax=Curtobacterium sp. MCPF17_002 TaxID=2175645 RepID=UPI000DAAB100|nr:FHA domain-containing protein [Curtobacterium sp. MCPF17_002]WIB76411.1 FHA domain-containing protein [Curtobacterium sp. MCPF17_002]